MVLLNSFGMLILQLHNGDVQSRYLRLVILDLVDHFGVRILQVFNCHWVGLSDWLMLLYNCDRVVWFQFYYLLFKFSYLDAESVMANLHWGKLRAMVNNKVLFFFNQILMVYLWGQDPSFSINDGLLQQGNFSQCCFFHLNHKNVHLRFLFFSLYFSGRQFFDLHSYDPFKLFIRCFKCYNLAVILLQLLANKRVGVCQMSYVD